MKTLPFSINGGKATRGGNGLGAKRLGHGGETTGGEKRGETTRGGNVLGAKRPVTYLTTF